MRRVFFLTLLELFALSRLSLLLAFLVSSPVRVKAASAQVELYGCYETAGTNANRYANTFDYVEIELRATFKAPDKTTKTFFGFYDGDGKGGQTGNVWRLRFMPDQTGRWTYSYSWTGTGARPGGGSGSFDVVDSGKYPGPLKISIRNPRYFMDARGNPFPSGATTLRTGGTKRREIGAGSSFLTCAELPSWIGEANTSRQLRRTSSMGDTTSRRSTSITLKCRSPCLRSGPSPRA